MRRMWPLIALLLAAPPPERAVFLFELLDTPVGTVTLELDGGSYRYVSRHLFTRGATHAAQNTERVLELEPDGRVVASKAVPEGLWLWKKPSPGCVLVLDEITDQELEACIAQKKGELEGTIGKEPFTAKYAADGRLQELKFGASRFRRVSNEQLAPPPDLFGHGFPIRGDKGVLRLEPSSPAPGAPKLAPMPKEEAEQIAKSVHKEFTSGSNAKSVEQAGPCLANARSFEQQAKAKGYEAQVVLGLFAEGSQAHPHAWVRFAGPGGKLFELDPTSLLEVKPETHLALSSASEAGKAYLELALGKRVVKRAP